MNRNKLNSILKQYFKLDNINIQNILIDSRKIKKNDLFIAIRGGNEFVKEALSKGAFVVFDKKELRLDDERAIQVEDSILFIQELASKYRKIIGTKIIAITGSNGKTTTKDIVYELLGVKFKGKKTSGNLNNHIGLPLTLLRVEDDDQYMVLEMGMSDFGEIELLSRIAQPDYAIITNIGDSHLEYLESRENVFKAKTEVVPFIKEKLFVNGDDVFLKGLDALKIGKNIENNLIIKDIKISETGSSFEVDINGKIMSFDTNLVGEHNIYNVSMALLVCNELKMDLVSLKKKLKHLSITAMRFELLEKGNTTYINDAYNASPVSMTFALETFSNLYKSKYRIAVLGDMLELGEQSRELHEALVETIINANLDEVYLYGKEMLNLYNKLKERTENSYYFATKEEISKKILEKSKEKAVLLKGSRGMKLEQIIQ